LMACRAEENLVFDGDVAIGKVDRSDGTAQAGKEFKGATAEKGIRARLQVRLI
jgi:hypothetical protein